MEPIRQCWAFNFKGHRCEHPAGHPGNHVVTAEWTDEECYAPPTGAPTPAPAPAPATLVTQKCVACQHMHKGGVCKCGCHEHIG